MKRAWALLAGLAGVIGAGAVGAAEGPAPVIFQSAPGQFEVAATDATAAQYVSALGGQAWAMLAAPLALPERFSSPVLVRLVPAAQWGEAAVFRVLVEAGGIVSVRLRWGEGVVEPVVRRALVQALLMRLAVTHHGVTEKLTVPLWLEQACVGWWRTRADAAQLDAAKQESARTVVPAIGGLLAWGRGEAETRALELGALWLLTFLQSESTKAAEWPALLKQLLDGEPAEAALAANFPGRFGTVADRELWWQTGWHQLRRANALPTLDAAASRRLVGGAARWVFARDDGTDAVMSLGGVLEHANEPLVKAELARRADEVGRVTAALHPFYRNAGLSLMAAFEARGKAEKLREAACAAFEQDWRDATELDATATAALDALEKR